MGDDKALELKSYEKWWTNNLGKDSDKVKSAEWRRPVAATTKSLLLIELNSKDS